ncbi:DENN domain-containing protein 2A-like isoform X3 [Pomacea canaliculata]|uniref:DENN domain-containing protein 2A-like isoform X3 n=1 Tax=Pomacea canaliculata TaxID=400727 RepID=UPI000D735FEC|nr:DENN domain-containing protein 2A-like isoform X3 [Pomacea canaliculata]
MSRDSNSIRNLPPGKLKDIKKLFEAGTNIPAGGTLFGTPAQKPALFPRPVVEAQPRPAPRQLPSAKNVSEHGSQHKEEGEKHLSVSLPYAQQGYKGDWFSSIDRKSVSKAGSKALSPTVQRRVTQFIDAAVSDGEKVTRPSITTGHMEVHRRFVSAGAYTGSSKRRSDPGSDQDSGKELNGCKRPMGERRRTVDNVDLGADSDVKEVKVSEMLKTFEKKVPCSEKPSLPKKPTSVAVNRSHSGAQETSHKPPVTDENYEAPWDSGKIIERFKIICLEGTASMSQPDVVAMGRGRQPPAAMSTGTTSSPKHPRSIARPTEQPPPPPSKPPRTFVHDKYLKVKGPAPPDASTGQEKKKVNIHSDNVSEPYNKTGKERISICADENQEKSLTSDQYTHLNKSNKEGSSETVGIREHPPARPPPPRPRPLSEFPASRHLLKALGDSDSESEGPVVISLKQGKKLSRHKSITGRRDPSDQLPEPPDGMDSIQRFPLRKSFSSECLNKGSLSSLSDGVGEDLVLKDSMMRSYHAKEVSDAPLYEAVIDPEGYAVPHQFLRIQHSTVDPLASHKPLSGIGDKTRFQKLSSGSPVSTTTNTATPLKDQDIKKVSQKKMTLVQRKINQAYETLQLRKKPESISESDQDGTEQHIAADEKDSDSDSIVDINEIKKRVVYCSTIRMKTHQASLKAKQYLDMIYPQLFEYALIVGLCPKTDDPGYEPYIIHKFPQTRTYKVGQEGYLLFCSEMVNSNVSVPKFCFPDADEFRPGTAVSISESYSFVLTNIDGGRVYGYCRRMQPRDASLPEVICIISPVDAFNMYNKLLKEIESRRLKSMDNAQEIIAASFGRPLPKPGKVCHIRCLVNYESLICYLGTEKLIKVFSSMLMERRLILCSNQLSTLTQTIHALVALLYPFTWQHVFIPILPLEMIEVCAAPTPFIIGILQTHLSRVLSLALEDVIIVDLDKKLVLRCAGDEMTIIPPKVLRALKTAINMCKIDTDAKNSQWLIVKEAFLRMFVEVVGHFGQHITTQQDGTKTLSREQFIAGVQSKSIRQFLEWFSETQMFHTFINMQLERQEWATMDLFMTRLKEHQEQQMDTSRCKGIGQKVKNIGKAIKTKLVT